MYSSRRTECSRWVRERIARLRPGERFPTDAAIAARFSLSRLTVSRVVAEYVLAGVLVRIPGSGTFASPGPPRGRLVRPPHETSSTVVLNRIRDMMYSGELRAGEALPAVKYLTIRWRVSRTTVMSAFRELVRLGLVTRIGRTYWNSTAVSRVYGTGQREVILYTSGERVLRRVFRRGPFAVAFRIAEDLLAANGYKVRYGFYADLHRIAHTLREGEALPHGLIFHGVNEGVYGEIAPVLQQLRRFSRSSVKGVIHWDPLDIDQRPPRLCPYLSQLGMTTALVHAIATFAVRNGYTEVRGLIRQRNFYSRHLCAFLFWDFLWLRAELKRINPDVSFRLVVVRGEPDYTREGFVQAMDVASVRKALSRYTPVSPETLAEEVRFIDRQDGALPKRGCAGVLLVAQHDSDAAALLAAAHSARMSAPRDFSLLSVDNNPSWYHLGISRCEVDWYGVGHTLAHCVIGDMPPVLGSEGELRVQARVLGKQTTPSSG